MWPVCAPSPLHMAVSVQLLSRGSWVWLHQPPPRDPWPLSVLDSRSRRGPPVQPRSCMSRGEAWMSTPLVPSAQALFCVK